MKFDFDDYFFYVGGGLDFLLRIPMAIITFPFFVIGWFKESEEKKKRDEMIKESWERVEVRRQKLVEHLEKMKEKK